MTLCSSRSELNYFCKEFGVQKKLAASYMQHLKELELKKKNGEEPRRRKKTEEQSKTYESYDWVESYK